MIETQNSSARKKKNDLRTYENIRKLLTGQGDGYITACLLDYP